MMQTDAGRKILAASLAKVSVLCAFVVTLATTWPPRVGGLRCKHIHRLATVSTLTAMFTFVGQLGAEENLSPTVGAEGRIEQIILPGTELIAKPLDDRKDEIVVRVIETFTHGDGFRYDLQFYGMEPGKYDLSDWLVRKDGSSTDDLPQMPIEIRSLLPPGQIRPNELQSSWFPRMGGYKMLAIMAAVLWSIVLLALIFWPRKKDRKQELAESRVTFADLLHQRIETALKSKMTASQHAELERMLFAFWRKRLNLESLPPDQALARIKADADAGPLVNKLEEWMHSPNPDRNIDLKELLRPYADMPVPGDADISKLAGSGAV